MTQVTATRTQPQADGADRPFDTNSEPDEMPVRTGPKLVITGAVGPAFRPPASHQIAKRDADVTALVEPMARMLYQAFQAQHFGLFDDVSFDELEPPAKQKLVDDARVALHLQSPLYRAEVERLGRLTVIDAMATSANLFPLTNPVADEREQERRKQAMTSVTEHLRLVDLPNLLRVSDRMVLTKPLPWGADKQVTLTALRGMF